MQIIKHKSKKEIEKNKSIEIENFNQEIKGLNLQEISALKNQLEDELKRKIRDNRCVIASCLRYPKYSTDDAILYSRITLGLGILGFIAGCHFANAGIGLLTFSSISALGLFSIWRLPSVAEKFAVYKENKVKENNSVLVEKINILNKEKNFKNLEIEKN